LVYPILDIHIEFQPKIPHLHLVPKPAASFGPTRALVMLNVRLCYNDDWTDCVVWPGRGMDGGEGGRR